MSTPVRPTEAEVQPAGSGTNGNPPQQKKKAPWIIALAAVAALAIGGGAIAANNAKKKAEAYEAATADFESGDYQEAADAFESLGDYEDASAMAKKSLIGVSAQAEEEDAGEDPAAWETAAETYEQLDGDYPETEAQVCHDYASYYKGKRLMDREKWSKAKKAFRKISNDGFEDTDDLIEECNAHIAYRKAEKLYAAGSYYDAYVAFNNLIGTVYDGLPNFAERAQACIQETPDSGTLYSNPDYPSTDVPLTINNSFGNTFMKLYIGEDLVRSVYIKPNDSVTVELPAGTYRMNEAHGENWFGENDMFGGTGGYYHCIFGDEDTAELRYGYAYEISSSYGIDSGGTGIGNEAIDMDSF